MSFHRWSKSRRKRQQALRDNVAPVVPMLPEGCGYMGYEFGGGYIDSQCFGGRLYDLDNCDDDMLYEPCEYFVCPMCQTEAWLEREAKEISEGISGFVRSSLPQWKDACCFILKINRAVALPLLEGQFKTVTYLADNDARDDLVEHQYTFDHEELMATN